jgi:hypothetical protein
MIRDISSWESTKGDRMRTRTIGFILVTLFVAAAVCLAADDAFMGTWKLDEVKSKITPGQAKNQMVVYSAADDRVKVTIDGVDASGKPIHSEWTGKLDGKDYPLTGDPDNDMRALARVNDQTLRVTEKKGGKVTVTGRIVVAADGKSRTVTTTSTDANGKKTTSTRFYDKQ